MRILHEEKNWDALGTLGELCESHNRNESTRQK